MRPTWFPLLLCALLLASPLSGDGPVREREGSPEVDRNERAAKSAADASSSTDRTTGAGGAVAAAPSAREIDDLAAVRALEEGVAMVLAEQGFEAYAELFDSDYRNWADDRPLRERDEFLARVESWYAAGNRAVRTELSPVSIELFGDLALSLYRLTEEFADGSRFTGRFVSLARKRDGRWRLFRTTFTTVERVAAPEAAARPKP